MVVDLVGIVETAKSVPMSASCVVNRAEVLDMLHQLRADLAEELDESRRVMAERDEVIAQARRDAEDHLAEARRERGSMLSGTEMGREAERIRNEALREAHRIREDADAYVDDKLANFEVVLTKTLQAVGRGRAKMGGRDPMEELGQHVAEQDVLTAASRADYEYDERDQYPTDTPYYDRDSYRDQPDTYDEQAVYAQVHALPLPEPDFSHELTTADMSGIFQRPDFSQPPLEQPVPQPAYGYAEQGGYAGYAEEQPQAYPVQPYGTAYGAQPEYHTGEYPAYAEDPLYGQQPPQLPQAQHQPAHQAPQAQGDATGFFDTGVIDVRQFRDDPYQR